MFGLGGSTTRGVDVNEQDHVMQMVDMTGPAASLGFGLHVAEAMRKGEVMYPV